MFVHTEPSTIYVSPTGRGDGSTEENASDFQWVVTHGNVMPGDTIVLLDGTYTGNFYTTVNGDIGNDITIKPKTYGSAIIDGSLQIGDFSGVRGLYNTVRGLRVYYSDITDRGEWTDPNDYTPSIRPTSIHVAAYYCKVINNYIHDGGGGINAYGYGDSLIAYGNVVWNNGWANVGGAAQSLYINGSNKEIKHNIFVGGFKKTVAVYTSNGIIEDITLTENVIFEKTLTLFGGDATQGTVISASAISNHILNNGLIFGYTKTPMQNGVITGNRIYGDNPLTITYFQYLTINNNKFIGQEASGNGCFEINYTTEKISYTINNNEYRNLGVQVNAFLDGSGDNINFAAWQAAGYDADGSYSTELPSVNETFVYANEYPDTDDPRMGIVVIWNWAGDNTVAVDLTDLGLEVGTTYRWRQAQDPLVDVDTWECAGNSYTFAMTGHTVAKPIGFDEELIPTQFPTFGCFIIEKV